MSRFVQPGFNCTFRHRACQVLFVSACLLPYTVEADDLLDKCGPATLTEPVKTKIDNNRPNISWQPVAGASAYRIKLESRVPEGEKVFSAEIQVTAPNFLPAKPLTESRAHVRAAITTICGNTEGPTAIYQFDIDTAPACGADSNVRFSKEGDVRQLRWVGPKSAQSHNVWVYAVDTGKLLSNAEVTEPRWVLPADLSGPAVIATRPKCPSGQGMFSYLAF
jgi:hypothetical protein